MDEYLSEREQVAHIRTWVRENAPWALAGILLAVAALVGWQQWQSWQERQAQSASELYSQTIDALARDDREAATRLATQLKSDYDKTPYADLAELALARFHVDAGRWDDAATYLADVMNTSRDAELKLVARLRLARVQRAAGKLDEALATLAGAEPGGLAAAYASVRGDVLLDQGDREGALAAWREAAAAAAEDPQLVDRQLLELKIANVGGTASPGTAPVAVTAGTDSAEGAP